MIERGKFGIEHFSHPTDDRPSGVGWIVALVAVAGAASLAWTLVGRYRAAVAEDAAAEAAAAEKAVIAAAVTVEAPVETNEAATAKIAAEVKPKPAVVEPKPAVDIHANRPPKVRNLLMRLAEAEKRRDVEMAVTTIEQIRALPGSPAADLDDALARRLGTLNLRRLFVLKNAQWVTKETVRSGMYAGRIAAEHGSTLASCAKLNGGNVDKLRVGDSIWVMNHPRFNLVIHRRSRMADLSLNGKFFRRYDIDVASSGQTGSFEMPVPSRTLWSALGVKFNSGDRAEIEMLLPKGTGVVVSEL